MAELSTEQPRPVRRKFAMPPVKLACLSWYGSRDRVFALLHLEAERLRLPSEQTWRASHPQEGGVCLAARTALEIHNFVDPGAALGQLPELPPDSDFIFDNLFLNPFPDPAFDETPMPQQTFTPVPEVSGPLVRTYRNNHSLLQAYYCWVHTFVPILPAPEISPPLDEPVPISQNHPDGFSSGLDFSSPVALALSAVLALVPCAEDTDPSSSEAVPFRRNCAQFFAQAAIESIEAESEIPGSSTAPEKTLESEPPTVDRLPFHPRVPVELESIIALNLLSVYEYAQRGNLKKMRSRAGQALMEAMMTFNLHNQTDDDDYYAEAKRRVWWMTYMCATQTAIVSCTPPPLELFGVSFTTKYPTLEVDPEAWPTLIETQQSMLSATQFIVDLSEAVSTRADMEPIYRKLVELENGMGPLADRCDAWAVSGPLAPIVDASETCLVRSLRSMARTKVNSARIKVHRYCAFGDYPVFSGKMCDLQSTADMADGPDLILRAPCMCGLSSHSGTSKTGSPDSHHQQQQHTPSSGGTPETIDSMGSSSCTRHGYDARKNAPYTSHFSAKICLRSALNIANDYDNMPYPNPSGQFGQDLCFLSPTSPIVAPRMLPSYVCCAMQGAYVFLSIYRKTSTIVPGTASSGYLVSMLLQLQQGLMSILAAIENYATAFEAIRAMRDQVRKSAESLIMLKP
ncbi:c6 zinc finger domain containing protein [Grosmannia clavigera kw1407]|uniref:C6 zinc finger domain containing protein n=1 Tax=Grosmannia clavigera (strain kw1407 / UAMH 11150) TaxID=655863 RepID=F0XJ02_GROCL|nr:c6 zinc finger domain containing protein [Grosmannia clavigera kw1407]EFX02418.1 c6 zinc finger domain containing protein [Grosmannia clavigera kw1407]